MCLTASIRKMADAIPGSGDRRYFCNRCKMELALPLEERAVYVLDQETDGPALVCPGCVKSSDLYLWGDPSVLK